ncbi:class A beta-lactamase [Luteimonas sp. 100069]|uniref:class A beta-lactamase n=1 Tax=Luteimonas sp. 100069 TaxID=2006109 RepID=UPI000F5166F8|nr:class A beta-lactamase [Luteimonas sp. 100069]RPD85113.1 class A beta-lactamase [Luteimonas sp. 100069]
MPTRRHLLIGAGNLLLAAAASPLLAAADDDATLDAALAALEQAAGGRLGIALFDTGTGRRLGRREKERFPMCSTFKALLAGAVLHAVERGHVRLDQPVDVAAGDLVPYSPYVETRVAQGNARVDDLCRATVTLSDNAAANLLLPLVGGTSGLTAFLRALGDPVTRLDRWEPDLNEAARDDPRDTTSPRAMVDSLQRLLFGDVLRAPLQAVLAAWLIENRTGEARIRAGVPAGWIVGDKTGTCGAGTAADVAVLYPPARAPLLLAVYVHGAGVSGPAIDALQADVARAVLG